MTCEAGCACAAPAESQARSKNAHDKVYWLCALHLKLAIYLGWVLLN